MGLSNHVGKPIWQDRLVTGAVTAESVSFDDGGRAVLVRARRTDTADELLEAAGLLARRPTPVIVVCGSAEFEDKPLRRATRLVGPAVAEAARRTGAVVVDGATDAGVMRLTGAARRATRGDAPSVLLGVAPAGLVAHPGGEPGAKVALEPNHTHLVLADSDEWGGETRLLMDLAATLAGGAPVVVLLAGGGEASAGEVLEATRRGWPVFVLEGTGGLADRLGKLWRRHRQWRLRRLAPILPDRFRHPRRPSIETIDDPVLAEIVADVDLRIFQGDTPATLIGRLGWALRDEASLKAAWERFAAFDALATRMRLGFEHMQVAILVVGILATLFALLHDALAGQRPHWLSGWLHWSVVVLPILVSVLMALANRRAAGNRWVLLRAAAESIKSELYRYRTRTTPYGDAATRNAELTGRVERTVEHLMQTGVSSGPVDPYWGQMPPSMYGASADDDGIGELDADAYLKLRVGNQLDYYRDRTRGLNRRRGRLQFLAIAAGGAGSILAAAGVEIWIGLTTAISAAAVAYVGDLRVDSTIVAYNQAASRLEALRDRWTALAPELRPKAFDRLVADAEDVLLTELGGWVEQMNESIRKRMEAQAAEAHKIDPNGTAAQLTGRDRAR
jgi:SLOG in TRPM, prokaryote/SMODS and SLOG-associating 2TM effector domain 1/Protein of unknown function (DUF4231)